MILDKFIKAWNLNNSETPVRSLVKAYSYRCCGTFTTMIISYVVTGKIIVSLAIGTTEIIVKPFIYWLHERAWSRIKWGRS